MAKLKINAGLKLDAKLPEITDAPVLAEDRSGIEKVTQSISSVSNGIAEMKLKLQMHEVKMSKSLSHLKKELKKDGTNDSKRLDGLERDIDGIHNCITASNNRMTVELQKIKDAQPVIQQVVPNVVSHKNNDDDIILINGRISKVNTRATDVEIKLENEIKKQRLVNKVLGVGLVVLAILQMI